MNLFLNMTQRNSTCFLNMSERIEIFWLKELNFFFWKKLSKNWTPLGYHSKDWTSFFFFSKYDSKNWTLLFCSVWLRNFPSFFHDSNTWTFFTWLKELNLLFYETQLLEPFWKFLIQRSGLFFFQDSPNWIFFNTTHRIEPYIFEYDSQNWTLFGGIRLTEIDFSWMWRNELNRFLHMTQRTETFNFLKMTQRIEPFNVLNMTQRIEPFFFSKYDSKNWIFSYLNMTQRTKLFLKVWLKELNSLKI